ncbi:MAG: hypothetical protein AAB914_00805 [Patescibacteria group bacterium]
MTKKVKTIYRWHKKLQIIRPEFILVFAIIMTIISGYSLRQNNLKMIELKKAVEIADLDNGDVEKALRDLRVHVYSHMNTNLSSDSGIKPPIQLKHQYERLQSGEGERVKQVNVQVNATATNTCAVQHPGDGFNQARVTCIQQYVSANAVSSSEIPTEFYKFDFVSPKWSPDTAGVTLILAIIGYILWIFRMVVDRILVRRMEDKF